MIAGRYGPSGDLELPRVVTISISRFERRLPQQGQRLGFSVRFHEQGTPVAWQRDLLLGVRDERRILAEVAALDDWTTGRGGRPSQVLHTLEALGERLFRVFLGDEGRTYLARNQPTAIMLDVDETVLSLPWELLRDADGLLAERVPFGRIVSTRMIPRRERDPLREDRQINLLAVLNPTGDMPYIRRELEALRKVADANYQLEVLERATKATLRAAVKSGKYDVVHFSGHGSFDGRKPGASGLLLADGELTTLDILELPWKQPPYLVFNSACWSGRAAKSRRLAHPRYGGNGVAAAFLAGGVAAFAGWFWPVSMRSAATFTEIFYRDMLRVGSVGEAFRIARQAVMREFAPSADIGGYGAILYGDAGTGTQRRDLEAAAPPARDLLSAV